MSTQELAPTGHYTVRQGTDGWYALGPDGGQRGPFDTSGQALQAVIDAAAEESAARVGDRR